MLMETCVHRTFLTRAYPTMKKNNPDTPILIREAQGILPKVYARYGSFAFLPIYPYPYISISLHIHIYYYYIHKALFIN